MPFLNISRVTTLVVMVDITVKCFGFIQCAQQSNVMVMSHIWSSFAAIVFISVHCLWTIVGTYPANGFVCEEGHNKVLVLHLL